MGIGMEYLLTGGEHKNAGQKEAASNSSEVSILSSWSFRFPLYTQQLASHEVVSLRISTCDTLVTAL
ncbi:hypothetical protein ACSBR2_002647 [Camellia fascicularis]